MKCVITTVGTSLFTNYNERCAFIKPHYDVLKKSLHREWNDQQVRILQIRNNRKFTQWISGHFADSCAEISSLMKIVESEQDDVQVRLLATDTVLSRLAAEMIAVQNIPHPVDGKTVSIQFDSIKDVINGLQVDNAELFEADGLQCLVQRLIDIQGNAGGGKHILNITGGYKGLIPYLTLIGQINKIPAFYLYEESEKIIKIPELPIQFDWVTQERFFSFCLAHKGIEKRGCQINDSEKSLVDGFGNFMIIADGRVKLNSMGKLLHSKIENDEIESRCVLGFMMEYKLIKYFNSNRYWSNGTTYSVVEKPSGKSSYNDEEIDLIIKESSGSNTNYIAIEVKSYNGRHAIKDQLQRQIHGFNGKKYPSEYHIILYRFLEYDQNIKKQLRDWFSDDVASVIQGLTHCSAHLALVYVDWMKYSVNQKGSQQNPYSGYLGADDPIDIEYIV